MQINACKTFQSCIDLPKILYKIRLATEIKTKADEFERLYTDLLDKQKATCVVGVPDRPAQALYVKSVSQVMLVST